MRDLSQANIQLATRCLIEWQLPTMVGPNEASGKRWDEIDRVANVGHMPAERMKKKRAHKIPLTPQMLALLDVMAPISRHREYVFPGDISPREAMNKQTANMVLKRMGYAGKLVTHGLRSPANTVLNEHQFSSDMIEFALAHIDSNQTRRDYNKAEYLEQR
ncbi:tyrosine-type recombinase/integrase [Porticoccaceae bacterium]|nr:tyrosine-type recombinase/integrase [Porticoccaceae bacterium]